jgi:hypothetical protein
MHVADLDGSDRGGHGDRLSAAVTAAAAAAVAIACDDELGARESKKDGAEDGFEGGGDAEEVDFGVGEVGKEKAVGLGGVGVGDVGDECWCVVVTWG